MSLQEYIANINKMLEEAKEQLSQSAELDDYCNS